MVRLVQLLVTTERAVFTLCNLRHSCNELIEFSLHTNALRCPQVFDAWAIGSILSQWTFSETIHSPGGRWGCSSWGCFRSALRLAPIARRHSRTTQRLWWCSDLGSGPISDGFHFGRGRAVLRHGGGHWFEPCAAYHCFPIS